MSLLDFLRGGGRSQPVPISIDHNTEAACEELVYYAKKACKKMPKEKALAAIRGEIVRMGLPNAEAVALYNAAHSKESA